MLEKNKDVVAFKKNFSQLQMIIKEVEQLYVFAFKVFAQILKPQSRVVTVWPFWRLGSKFYFLDILSKILALGFQVIDPLAGMRFSFKEKTLRQTILYRRPDQVVGREIVVLEYGGRSM